jgi:uncharacterized glyoxalase superfamily protein PhnB
MIPFLSYRDSKAAVRFLEEAFGFEAKLVVENEGTVVHAQVGYGTGMVMMSDVTTGDGFLTTAADVGKPTGGVYVVIDGDVDAHAARAEQAGATIVRPPADQDYGGREYTCRDPEGNLWSFGTYDPWAPVDD